MTETNDHLLIVGAGHAAGILAASLRQSGWTGGIDIAGDEPFSPYQRPPLSKAWLKGEANSDTLALRSDNFYAEHDIGLHLGNAVTGIDMAQRQATLADGRTLAFGQLVLATGARPKLLPLPGADQAGVYYLRSAVDAEQLKAALAQSRRIAVIGGGYLGLEVAASARALGVDAAVIEREPRLLARVASPEVSDFFQSFHAAQGVTFELGATIESLTGNNGRVTAVRLADGRDIAADTVLISIGAAPNDQLAQDIGCACNDGIIVDISGRTSHAGVYAIGDVTRRPLPVYGSRMMRMESVPSALEQARLLAHHLTGRADPPAEVPWFWSDQYDLKLQIAGMPVDVARTVTRGHPADKRFAVFHLDSDNRVQSVEAINMPAEFMFGRRLIGNRKPVDPDKLVDPAVPIRDVIA